MGCCPTKSSKVEPLPPLPPSHDPLHSWRGNKVPSYRENTGHINNIATQTYVTKNGGKPRSRHSTRIMRNEATQTSLSALLVLGARSGWVQSEKSIGTLKPVQIDNSNDDGVRETTMKPKGETRAPPHQTDTQKRQQEKKADDERERLPESKTGSFHSKKCDDLLIKSCEGNKEDDEAVIVTNHLPSNIVIVSVQAIEGSLRNAELSIGPEAEETSGPESTIDGTIEAAEKYKENAEETKQQVEAFERAEKTTEPTEEIKDPVTTKSAGSTKETTKRPPKSADEYKTPSEETIKTAEKTKETPEEIRELVEITETAADEYRILPEGTKEPAEVIKASTGVTNDKSEETKESAEVTINEELLGETKEPTEKNTTPAEEYKELSERTKEPAMKLIEPAHVMNESAIVTTESADLHVTKVTTEETRKLAEEYKEPVDESKEPVEILQLPAKKISPIGITKERAEETEETNDVSEKPVEIQDTSEIKEVTKTVSMTELYVVDDKVVEFAGRHHKVHSDITDLASAIHEVDESRKKWSSDTRVLHSIEALVIKQESIYNAVESKVSVTAQRPLDGLQHQVDTRHTKRFSDTSGPKDISKDADSIHGNESLDIQINKHSHTEVTTDESSPPHSAQTVLEENKTTDTLGNPLPFGDLKNKFPPVSDSNVDKQETRGEETVSQVDKEATTTVALWNPIPIIGYVPTENSFQQPNPQSRNEEPDCFEPSSGSSIAKARVDSLPFVEQNIFKPIDPNSSVANDEHDPK